MTDYVNLIHDYYSGLIKLLFLERRHITEQGGFMSSEDSKKV